MQYGGGPGRGIAQWSVGGRWDTSRERQRRSRTPRSKGESCDSLNLQLEFIWYELTTFGYGFSQLKATTNVTDATVAFMDKYEICGTCASTQRIALREGRARRLRRSAVVRRDATSASRGRSRRCRR